VPGRARSRWSPRSSPASWPAASACAPPSSCGPELDPRIPGSEPDPEIQDLLRASEGLNLGAGAERGPHLAQPEPAGLASEHLAHRPRRGTVLPPQLADPKRPFDAGDHVLRDRATRLAEAHAILAPQITAGLLREVTALIPPE
jgi:hypothetical protein